MPDCFIKSSLAVDVPNIRPASVEPPRSNPPLYKEPELRPEFGAYWRKAHLILRAIPQVKKTDTGTINNISGCFVS